VGRQRIDILGPYSFKSRLRGAFSWRKPNGKAPEIAAGDARKHVVVSGDESDGCLSSNTGLWFWI
jgi:hypothetical protein